MPSPKPMPTPTPSLQNQQPIEIISVLGPLQPINPGGPIVEITLKNVAVEPVVSLTATLELIRSFNFDFDVTSSNPLLPGKSISAKLTLIGGGFNDSISYPLTINGTLQNGATFDYIKQVQIVESPNKYMPVAGGQCEYVDIPGIARVVSVKQGSSEDTVEVTFNFVPNNPAAIDDYMFPNYEDTGQCLYVTKTGALERGLIEGSEHGCVRLEMTAGTCAPVVFQFTDFD